MNVRYLWLIVALSLAVFAGCRFLGHAPGPVPSLSPSSAAAGDSGTPIDWVAVSAAVSAVIAAVEALTRAISSLVAMFWKRKPDVDTPTQAGS